MKARIITDGQKGPNPDFKPPDPRLDKAAYLLYRARVPHSVSIEPGTIIFGPDCWEHCLMDGSGDSTLREPRPGVILAEPADEECQTIVDYEISQMTPLQKRMYDIAKSRADAKWKSLQASMAKAEEPDPKVDSE